MHLSPIFIFTFRELAVRCEFTANFTKKVTKNASKEHGLIWIHKSLIIQTVCVGFHPAAQCGLISKFFFKKYLLVSDSKSCCTLPHP